MQKLLNTKEACEFLNVSRTWLYRNLINNERIKPVRMGRDLRFKREDLEKIINESQE